MLTTTERRLANLQDPDHVILKPLQFKTIVYAHIKAKNQLLLFDEDMIISLSKAITCIKGTLYLAICIN